MKKKLLLSILSIFLISEVSQAQIKYWDFGAKDLGAGYDNMLPVEHLNALSNRLRHLTWVDGSGNTVVNYADGVEYAVTFDSASSSDWQYENGESPESILNNTFDFRYDGMNFEIYSRKRDADVNGVLISGSSAFTKPQMMPDLDADVNMTYNYDSTNDRILTVNDQLTRYDERTAMPDDVSADLFPGCIQFTTAGEKRADRDGGRGFTMNLAAGEYLTVVGSGEYGNIDDEGDPVRYGYSTGYFQFEYLGTGAVVNEEDFGTGKGSSTGPIDGPDQGDESVRVMEFRAIDAGQYVLRNRGFKIRIYRMYISSTSIKSQVESTLDVEELVASKVSTDVQARANRIYVSNVTSKTEINVYSITGALIKSISTTSDMDFSFRSGLYIATVKTAEGQKSVKLLVK